MSNIISLTDRLKQRKKIQHSKFTIEQELDYRTDLIVREIDNVYDRLGKLERLLNLLAVQVIKSRL